MYAKSDDHKWESKHTLRILLFMQYFSVMNMIFIPSAAIHKGITGFTIVMNVVFLLLGTPIAYMESIVGQFSERDCIDVWKIRPCLSHVGYLLICWQIIVLVCNHVVTSFLLHYLFMSFEDPIPYSVCGKSSTKYCNIMVNNFTINQDCSRHYDIPEYCSKLYRTYPEYQYWRHHMTHMNDDNYHMIWRACLESAIICLLLHFICFKRETSLKYSVPFLCVLPAVGLVVILFGSMRQVGVLNNFQSAVDLDFEIFLEQFSLTNMVQLVVQNLRIGTGLTFNLTSSSSFRTTCFSNCVIGVSLCSIFTTIAIICVTLMGSSYAYMNDQTFSESNEPPLYFYFESIPRFLSVFTHNQFYLILVFGIVSFLGISTNVLIYFSLFEMLLNRSRKLQLYPGLTCFVGCTILYFVTMPLLSAYGLRKFAFRFRNNFILIPTFIALLESIVFVFWYGINKFSEDIHYMLGIQPNMWMKFAWILAFGLLSFVVFKEMFIQFQLHVDNDHEAGNTIYMSIAVILIILFGILVHVIIAIFQRNMWRVFVLDPQWGPKNEVLQRSRGMFSAQAMTKEYMYRQYHLQAGILARQKASNIRV